MSTHTVWGEFNQDYKGVLTYETEGAPRVFICGSRRFSRGTVTLLEPEDIIQPDQVVQLLPNLHSGSMADIKGGIATTKIWSIQDILQRAACKKGRQAIST